MKRAILTAALLAAATLCMADTPCRAVDGVPDQVCTPGAAMAVPLADLCHRDAAGHFDYLQRHPRRVSRALKLRVLREYGLPASALGTVEVDHRVPRSLGGQDILANLWPQPYRGKWGAYQKDALERAVRRHVCAGRMTVGAGVWIFMGDWREGLR